MKNKEDYFNQYLQTYICTRDAWILRRQDLFVSLFVSRKTDIILDAGCGVGAYSYCLWKKKRNVISADVSVEALRIGKAHYQFPHPVCCDLSKLPFRDNSFSKIILIEVVEHIKKQSKLFSELRRVLRIGGTVLVTTSPLRSNILFPLIERARRCMILGKIFRLYVTGEHIAVQHPDTLKESLRKHGFEIAWKKYWNTLHCFHFLSLFNIHKLPFAFIKGLSDSFAVFDDFFGNKCTCNDMIVLAKKFS